MDRNLEHGVALVTGAGGGIGRGISLALGAAGCRVAVNYLDTPDAATETVKHVTALGVDAIAVQGDVRVAADVDRMVAEVTSHFGALTVMVNNAGVQTVKPLLELDEADWDLVIDTNLKGCFLCTRAAGRWMRDHGGGNIVNIGSGSNKLGFPQLAAYTASKGGIEMLTKVAAAELGRHGIRVNCIAPGAIETERTQQETASYARTFSRYTPLGRIGTPADVGRAVAMIVGSDAAFITGQTIWVDGGLFGATGVDRPVTLHDAALLVDSKCELGEGLSWCARRHAWLWTDIDQSRIWSHRPSDGETRSFATPAPVGTFVVCASGALLVGLAKGLGLATLDERFDVQPLVPVEADLPTRINDGRTDRSGAFVFGTYNAASADPIASIYQYTRAHGLRRLDVGFVNCANSICFSADGATMFFCDSSARRIMQCDYDSERAHVGPVTVFVELGPKQGLPDGSIIDRSGGLWNAEWGSGRVRRYDMSGQMTDEVKIAALHATCPAFGGPDLGDLCVTSARPAPTSARYSTAGGLFHARIAGMQGIPDQLFLD